MKQHPVVLLTGETHSGKTTCLTSMLSGIKQAGWNINGWTAPAITAGGVTRGYNLRFLQSGKELPFCRTATRPGWFRLGRFWYNREGIAEGMICLEQASSTPCDLVIIDEIGPFELAGKLWAPGLEKFISQSDTPLLLVVRKSAADNVVNRWNFRVIKKLEVGGHPSCIPGLTELKEFMKNRQERN